MYGGRLIDLVFANAAVKIAVMDVGMAAQRQRRRFSFRLASTIIENAPSTIEQ